MGYTLICNSQQYCVRGAGLYVFRVYIPEELKRKKWSKQIEQSSALLKGIICVKLGKNEGSFYITALLYIIYDSEY